MNIKLIFCSFFVLVASAVSISACGSAKIFFYEHVPSKNFYKSYDFENKKLSEFKVKDTLLVVSLKQSDLENYIVWLGFYSGQAGNKIFVKKADFYGEKNYKSVVINKQILIDNPHEKTNLMNNSIELFQLSGVFLQDVFKSDKNLFVRVIYSDLIDGEDKEMNFKLEQRVEKHTIFPT